MDHKSELVGTACKLNAVSDSHQWVDLIVKRQGEKEDIVLYKIISLVSEHERWADYIREIREWLQEKKKDFGMSVN